MSMMVDRTPTVTERQKDWTIRPSLPVTWIPDERVKRCFGCGTTFSTFRRKHHCRSCGRVFCSACTAYRELIPSYYFSFSGIQPNQTQRTCAACTQNLKRAAEVEHLIRMLSLLPVLFEELFVVRLINKQWNYATNTMLSIFRGLQYKLSCQEYSNLECDFLKSHYKEFYGHVIWQIHTVVSFHQKQHRPCKNEEVYQLSCRRLMCSRICHSGLSVEDILRLGTTGCFEEASTRAWVIDAWKRMTPESLLKMMPWWVYFGCRFTDLFKKGLIPLCAKRIDLTYALWFECELQKALRTVHTLEKVQKRLQKQIPAVTNGELFMSRNLVRCFRNIITSVSKERRGMLTSTFFQEYGPARLPWNTDIVVVKMTVTKQLTSSSKPFILQMTTKEGPFYNVLLKQEDVRTDRLAMTMGYWINNLTVSSSSSSSCKVYTYDVFPINSASGVVQMIPATTTLYDIQKSSTTLLNYIMSCNESLPVKTLRQRVISSTAGACLLAFTMGLGDRHLENILVCSDAHLVHVDFGFVLGDDPKHAHTPMRITEDMIDAMGGKQSSTFVSFVKLTQQGYAAMRLHTSFWYHLLSAEFFIFGDKRHHWKRVRDHVLDRFVPGEWNDQASLQIESVVQQAAKSSWYQSFLDLTHTASNQMGGIFQMDL